MKEIDSSYIRTVCIIDPVSTDFFQMTSGRLYLAGLSSPVKYLGCIEISLHIHTHVMFAFPVQRYVAITQENSPLIASVRSYNQFVFESQKIIYACSCFNGNLCKIPVLQPGAQVAFFQLDFLTGGHIPPFLYLNDQRDQ